MPTIRPAFWNYDNARDGSIAVGTVISPWFDFQGIQQVFLQGSFVGGSTQVFVDFSTDGLSVASSSTDQAAGIGAGARVPVATRYARIRIVQATATATTALLGARGETTVAGSPAPADVRVAERHIGDQP